MMGQTLLTILTEDLFAADYALICGCLEVTCKLQTRRDMHELGADIENTMIDWGVYQTDC